MIKSAFLIVVGSEREEGDKTLQNTVDTLGKYFSIIRDPKDIRFDTNIYIIGHGNDPMFTKKMELGNETARKIFEKFYEDFSRADFRSKPFCGRIILEGCHTAEFSPNNREDFFCDGKLIDFRSHAFKSLKEKSEIDGGSLLTEFVKLFEEKFKKLPKIVSPETEIGGYLGAAFDGDYSITGFGKASTTNPITIKFQERRGVKGEITEGGILYDETKSFVNGRFGRESQIGGKNTFSKGSSR